MKRPSLKTTRAKAPVPAPVPDAPIEQVAAGIHPATAPSLQIDVGEMPSIGRIVIVLGRYPLSPEPPGPVGRHMPAIITGVHSPELIDCTLFPAGAAAVPCVRVLFGREPGQWQWPRQMPVQAG